jgi:rhodanese-related sulfurtransferase
MPNLFEKYGMITQGVLTVTPREANNLLKEGAFILDLRDNDFVDFKAFDVAHVIHIPMGVFDEHANKLDPDNYYILTDTSGLKSREYVQKLQENGYKHVANMSGGFVEWERDGLPVRVDVNERLSGSCACQLKPRERGKEV